MTKVYKHSHFKADIFGHGGNKRTAQINELLNVAGIVFEEVDFDKYEPAANHIKSFIKGGLIFKNLGKGFKTNYAIGRYLLKFEYFIKDCKPELFIWESTSGYYLLLAEILYKYKIPFIAIPHNIESLVNGNVSAFSKKKSPIWFNEEINFLRLANKVFTISREENWLLSLYGLVPHYLPYFPPKDLTDHFLNINKKRSKKKSNYTDKKKLLLLGTFYNPPTLKGYLEIIDALADLDFVDVKVAGFGSELLKNASFGTNVTVLGTLSFEGLAKAIEEADYALIHQEPSSGALTRITELLLCGLPILANNSASRSYYNFPGVITYSDMDELITLLRGANDIQSFAVERPIEEKNFIKILNHNQ